MTIETKILQRMAFTEEADGAFATDVTASATFLDMPFQEGTANVALNKPELDPLVAQQRKDSRNQVIFGPKAAELSFSVPLGATGAAAGDGVASPAHTASALLAFLKTIYGGVNGPNTGDTVASAAAAYTITPTTTTLFDGGEVVGWVNASGRLEARSLVQGSATMTLRDQLSATPSGSDVLYAGTTIHPIENPLTSIQMIVEGAEQDDRWLLSGGQVTSAPTLSVALGAIPTLSFTVTFAQWAQEPTAAITVASYGTFTPLESWESFRAINGAASGSISGVCLDASAVDFAFNAPVYTAAKSGCGTNTIKRWVRSRAVPFAAITVTMPYEDSSWFTERDDFEYYGLTMQIGFEAGSTILIEIPKAQVVNVQPVDADGLGYQTVNFSATTDSYCSAADDDDIRYAAFRLHFL